MPNGLLMTLDVADLQNPHSGVGRSAGKLQRSASAFFGYHASLTHWRIKRDCLVGNSRNMKPIFCGNLEYDARQSDVERLFRRYGKVDRVDLKSGFAFVYMDDERDAEDAIRRLDRTVFGRKGRQLRVEWTKQERGIRRPGGSRKSSANMKPSKTLFVINFDPIHTRTRDLERHFDLYGKILNIRIRRNFAFIQFESQEDATKALDATNMSKFMDRVISVEYAARDDDDDRRNGYSPERRGRDMSPDRRSHDRGRSPSPYHRDRASPDYGHGANANSRSEPRGSPNYDRDESPVNERYHSRSPPPRERSRS
ncbi:Serine/arginine-rich splicing factor RS31 [Vitis vinifera]|uniref:Serine/arginine-rich splicing factor RS31 n=1 Tax=Vitis vinifera TaxID=29760 RepID=A0A438DAX8_VITVI|nr:Serine/arginine-rich splicing factor RS31 [Vitis vinifera]